MSGGKYDYIHSANLIEFGAMDTLETVRDRLNGLVDAGDAAQEVQHILDALNAAVERRDALAEVLRALEWWDSGDYDEGQFREALAKFRARAGRGSDA
ncbi:hypothetical protein [Nocardia sp. IFM 10818]